MPGRKKPLRNRRGEKGFDRAVRGRPSWSLLGRGPRGDVPDPIGKIRRVALTRDALQGQWIPLAGVHRRPA